VEMPSSFRLKAFLRFSHFVGGEGEALSAVFPGSEEDTDWAGESESPSSSALGETGGKSGPWWRRPISS